MHKCDESWVANNQPRLFLIKIPAAWITRESHTIYRNSPTGNDFSNIMRTRSTVIWWVQKNEQRKSTFSISLVYESQQYLERMKMDTLGSFSAPTEYTKWFREINTVHTLKPWLKRMTLTFCISYCWTKKQKNKKKHKLTHRPIFFRYSCSFVDEISELANKHYLYEIQWNSCSISTYQCAIVPYHTFHCNLNCN